MFLCLAKLLSGNKYVQIQGHHVEEVQEYHHPFLCAMLDVYPSLTVVIEISFRYNHTVVETNVISLGVIIMIKIQEISSIFLAWIMDLYL